MKLHYKDTSNSASENKKVSKIQKMKTLVRHQICSSIAKQGGFMPSAWLSINSLVKYDRTPEFSGFLEDRVA